MLCVRRTGKSGILSREAMRPSALKPEGGWFGEPALESEKVVSR